MKIKNTKISKTADEYFRFAMIFSITILYVSIMCPYKIKLPCIKALMPWFSSKTPMAAFGVAKICPFLSHAAPAVSHTTAEKNVDNRIDLTEHISVMQHLGPSIAIGSKTWKDTTEVEGLVMIFFAPNPYSCGRSSASPTQVTDTPCTLI